MVTDLKLSFPWIVNYLQIWIETLFLLFVIVIITITTKWVEVPEILHTENSLLLKITLSIHFIYRMKIVLNTEFRVHNENFHPCYYFYF